MARRYKKKLFSNLPRKYPPLPQMKRKWDLLIYTTSGNPTSLKAAEWGLIRLRIGPDASKSHTYNPLHGGMYLPIYSSYAQSVRATRLEYKKIANNCIETHITFNRDLSFTQAKKILLSEIGSQYITFIKEDTPMLII